jgi:hypothetical protein
VTQKVDSGWTNDDLKKNWPRVLSPPRLTSPLVYVEIDNIDHPLLFAPPRMGEQPYKMGIFVAATRVHHASATIQRR